MIEVYGDLWEQYDADVIFITTNGFVKNNGEAVMGRGCALEAAQRWPLIKAKLGMAINDSGNVPHPLLTTRLSYGEPQTNPVAIWSFPVKHNWFDKKADIHLILDSAKLAAKSFEHVPESYKFYLPRPGCGNGGLSWEDVKPTLSPFLDDRFKIISKSETQI